MNWTAVFPIMISMVTVVGLLQINKLSWDSCCSRHHPASVAIQQMPQDFDRSSTTDTVGVQLLSSHFRNCLTAAHAQHHRWCQFVVGLPRHHNSHRVAQSSIMLISVIAEDQMPSTLRCQVLVPNSYCRKNSVIIVDQPPSNLVIGSHRHLDSHQLQIFNQQVA